MYGIMFACTASGKSPPHVQAVDPAHSCRKELEQCWNYDGRRM